MKYKNILLSIVIMLKISFVQALTINGKPTITHDIYPGPSGRLYTTWYHPYGYTSIEVFNIKGQKISEKRTPGPQFRICTDCGNSKAGYVMKIYSQQDPRSELFDKPLLITQGFDPNHGSAEQHTFKTLEDLTSVVFDLSGELQDPTVNPGILPILYQMGYDIAIVMFKDPHIDIVANAKSVLKAFKWMEAHSVKEDGSELVIIGPSMGGLVCRYALQLEGERVGTTTYGNSNALHAKLFVSFDAPNRGAYIPMSLQAFLDFYRGNADVAKRLYKAVTSTSALQMFIESVTSNKSLYNAFYNSINDANFRSKIKNITNYGLGTCPCSEGCSVQPIRTIAIANGGYDGYGLFHPSNHEYGHGEYKNPNVAGTSCRLKTLESGTKVRYFKGKLSKFGFPVIWQSRTAEYFRRSNLFAENAPGGYRESYHTIYQKWLDLDYDWKSYSGFFRIGFGENKFTTSDGSHCHIPTGSAAGLLDPDFDENDNNDYYTQRQEIIEGSQTMFDRAYLPYLSQFHVTISTDAKNWFLNEIVSAGLKCEVNVQFTESSKSNDESVSEYIIPVRLSNPAYQQVTVDFTVIDQTASSGTDYTLAPSTNSLTFAAGSTVPNEELKITVVNDIEDESNEYIQIELQNPVNADLGSITEFTYTIIDDDVDNVPPTITITSPTTADSYTSPSSIISLAGTASDNVGIASVTYSMSGATTGSGSATGTTNWHIPNLTINPGTTVITVTAQDIAGNTNSDVLTVLFSVQRLYVDKTYVDQQGGTSGNGTSWPEALRTIQEALDLAITMSPSETNPIEIWVADAEYIPSVELTAGDTRTKTFRLRPYVGLIGHFQGNSRAGGGETLIDQRLLNNQTYTTTLNGDLGTENVYHVVTIFQSIYSPEEYTIDGFRITGGNANGFYTPPFFHGDGGGLLCSILNNQNLTVKNCKFENNNGFSGSGLGSRSAGIINITNTEFNNNSGSNGGGVSIGDNVEFVQIKQCIFYKNDATNGGAVDLGNIFYLTNDGFIVDQCEFIENTASSIGGAILIAGSQTPQLESRISQSVFYKNTSTNASGGAIFVIGANSASDRNLLTIDNSLFLENFSKSSGGAIHNGTNENIGAMAALNLVNSTFYKNESQSTVLGGASVANNPGSGSLTTMPTISNCIMWAAVAGGEIWNSPSSSPIIQFCNIQGSGGGGSNKDIDPQFVTPGNPQGTDGLLGTTDDGLKLQSTSPSKNAGSNSFLPPWSSTDITGVIARILNGVVDMGAYEN